MMMVMMGRGRGEWLYLEKGGLEPLVIDRDDEVCRAVYITRGEA